MQFFVEPIWSWPLVVLTSLGLIALVLFTYRVQLKRTTDATSRTLLTLRLLAVLLLIFAMFRPALQKTDTDENPVQLLILSDVSRSMNTCDMPGGLARFKAVRADLAKYESKWKELGKQTEVRQFDFDRDLRPFDSQLTEGTGDQTAFGKVLEDLIQETRDRRTLGVILLTDGAQRAVPPYDADPFTAARKLGDSQLPIYAVGYGASSLSTASLDLAVEDLRVDPVVFEKKLVPISCKVRVWGANRKKIRVRVLIEDRTGKRSNASGDLKPAPATQQAKTVHEIEITKDADTIPIELSFVPTQPGELKVAIEAEPAENELLTRNNRRETIVTVKKGGLNVAYIDVLRPEAKGIYMVNGADKIQLDYLEFRVGKNTAKTKIDPAWFQKGRYDVYIIGDIRPEWIGADNLRQLATRLDEGVGLLMIGGRQNFSTGGYALTPLVDWLPVRLDQTEFRPPGVEPSPNSQLSDDVKMIPTEQGLIGFVMRLGSREKSRSLWLALPPVSGATRLKPSSDFTQIWAETPDKQPLLLAQEVGRARVAAFAVDSTWLWVSYDHAELHQRFWRQMILWLARKEADKDQPVWVTVEPRNYSPGATVPLNFGARTPDGSPLNNPNFEVEVTNPNGKSEKLTPRESNHEHSAEFSNAAEPGDYWVRVTARANGESAYTRFIVDARDLELDYPSADYDFLKELSSLSGGASLKPEGLGNLIERLRQTKMSSLTRIQVITLWDNWWLLLAFVSLMTSEWYLRKKSGLV